MQIICGIFFVCTGGLSPCALTLRYTGEFKRSLKRCLKRGYDEFDNAVAALKDKP